MALGVGTRLGAYEIAGSLGTGGMGEVYRAHDTGLKRDVAIKVLPASLANDVNRLARFQREAEMLAALNHSNVAHIYGLEKSEDLTALVMELVEGPTLAERIEQGPIAPDEALSIALQIADGLEAAHSRGIVHRDLKPANIKLAPDGTVKVLDFGIAKALDTRVTSGPQAPVLTTPAMTEVGIVLGTAQYMSPEQARGKQVDQRADIWAFGCVLYEMLTGQPAFGGEDVTIVLACVLEHGANMDSLPATISPTVRHTIKLCLEKDVRRRIRDIGDVRLALEGRFESDRSPSIAAAVQRPAWRRALPLVAAFAVGGLAVALIALSLRPAPEPRPVNRFDYAMPVGRSFRNMGRPELVISPDGRQFAYNSNQGLYLRTLGELEARLITQEATTSPMFSPDGQSLAYWDGTRSQFMRIGIGGGAAVPVTDVPANPFGVSWGRDGMLLIGQPEGVLRAPAVGGSPELVIEARDGERLYGPTLLPDGDSVLLTVTNGDWNSARILIESLATKERKVLIEGGSDARYLPTGHLVYAYGNELSAVAFDAGTLTVSGAAVPLVANVARANANQTAVAQFSVADSGTLVYATGNELSALRSLVWVDRQGRVEPIAIEAAAYSHPRISPDGSRVALEDNGNDLWIWDFVSETRARLTVGERNSGFPIWTPDSTRIAYALEGTGGIAWKAANNTGQAETLAAGVGGLELTPRPLFFEPSGAALVYSGRSTSGTGEDVGMVALGSSAEPVWLLNEPSEETMAALSPDGRWLAYVSAEGGRATVYVRPFPNVEADLIPVSSAGGGLYPVWSRDGSELFFMMPDDKRTIVAVAVETTGGRFAFGARTPLFDPPRLSPSDPSYDVAADGRFLFVTTQDADDAAARILIVENWLEEVQSLVPTK